MRVVGIIAEYNPFHRGHAYHLAEARRQAQADAVVVVMSSVFTQRGTPALLSPADRARMALADGADTVFALPAAWAVRDAEHFALGSVSILAGLGCSAISFGSEAIDLSLQQKTAHLLEQPDTAFRTAIIQRMDTGVAYPAAMSAALEDALPGCGPLLEQPNSTLAICYLRAMLRLNTPMDVVPVQRIGSYHESSFCQSLPSATALRGAILRGDWTNVRAAMPEKAFAVLKQAAQENLLHHPEGLDKALLYRLRTMSDADYADLPDISEGIEFRLRSAAQSVSTREALLQAAKTRRYPYARLSRLATHALLGYTDAFFASEPLPRAAWLLGFRREAKRLFAHFKEHASIPIISKAADFDRAAPWFIAEEKAYDIWSLGAGLPSGLAVTQGVSVL